MNILVGYTGFVGSNIYAAGDFDAVYNSKNIVDAYGTHPDLLVYAGLRAEKYLANHAPEKDWELILQAEDTIRKIDPRQLILVSTIDVFKTPRDVDETSEINTVGLHPYGYDRYRLEEWVRDHYPDAMIIRLPGLFGKNIKKNFIYDCIHRIPSMLAESKFNELAKSNSEIKKYYQLQDNGFYRLHAGNGERKYLSELFSALGFSALNFTDSRSVYQFYNLARLWKDIQTARESGIRLLHLATEPVSAGEIYEYICGKKFVNEMAYIPADYNFKTIHDRIFDGSGGYIYTKEQILYDIRIFISKETQHEMETE